MTASVLASELAAGDRIAVYYDDERDALSLDRALLDSAAEPFDRPPAYWLTIEHVRTLNDALVTLIFTESAPGGYDSMTVWVGERCDRATPREDRPMPLDDDSALVCPECGRIIAWQVSDRLDPGLAASLLAAHECPPLPELSVEWTPDALDRLAVRVYYRSPYELSLDRLHVIEHRCLTSTSRVLRFIGRSIVADVAGLLDELDARWVAKMARRDPRNRPARRSRTVLDGE